MATYALGAVGTAIGGPLGGFIGSTIGSLIDNQLFPTKTEGPRLNDLRVTSASYGEVLPALFGIVRCRGLVIWSTGLIESRTTVKQGKGGPSVQQTEYSYRASVAVAIGEGQIDGVEKILLNGKCVYDEAEGITDWGLWSDLQIYPGNFTQTPDPTIESYEGAGEVPAYRGTAYVVFSDLQLADFGNRLPNFEFVTRATVDQSLAGVINDICDRAGIDPNKVSTSSLVGKTVRGYAIGNASSGVGALQPLALAFNFDIAEQDGTLRFVNRTQGIAGLVPDAYLGGHESHEKRPETIRWQRRMTTDMPREASVVYIDFDRDLQQGTQRTERQVGSAQNNLSTQLALVLSADEAREVADRLLWEAWTAQQTADAATDDRCGWIECGKLYLFETPAGAEALRVTNTTRGANGVTLLQLARDRGQIYDPSSLGAPSVIPPNIPALPGDTDLAFIDGPLLLDSQDDTGFYWAVSAVEDGWRGASILRSTDGGVNYDPIATVGTRATIGTVESALGSAPMPGVWDRANSFQVRLIFDGHSLESRTELEVLNGANAAWIGSADGQDGEIIQFADAVLVSGDLWELSTFLRGRKGTEHAIGTSNIGDVFVLLDATTLRRSDFSSADWNKARKFKPVSLLTTEAATTAQDFTNAGESKRPLSPVLPTAVRDGSGDVTLGCTRRSRLTAPGLGNGDTPLGEAVEAYALEIWTPGFGALVRTESLSTPSFDYTSAAQTSDGLTPGAAVSGIWYMISDVRGRGHPLSFTA